MLWQGRGGAVRRSMGAVAVDRVRVAEVEEAAEAGWLAGGTGYARVPEGHAVHDAGSFTAAFGGFEKEAMPNEPVVLRGRVVAKRSASKSLYFVDVASGYEREAAVQVMATAKAFDGPKQAFRGAMEVLARGDCVAVTGVPSRTQRGQLALIPSEVRVEAPCVTAEALPEPGSMRRAESLAAMPRAGQLLLQPHIVKAVRVRARMLQRLRRVLDGDGFVEVETPILGAAAGGATARPFVTFHEATKREKVLRIAPELYLKQLVVGGLDSVYEVGKVFRNEGVDPTHLPEFSMAELYTTRLGLDKLMTLTEDMVRGFAADAAALDAAGGSECAGEVAASEPFGRVEFMEALNAGLGFDLDLELPTDELRKVLREAAVACEAVSKNVADGMTASALLDKLGGVHVEAGLAGPMFVTGHPLLLSPLAKEREDAPGVADRFELFLGPVEVANGYNEINNPLEQLVRFEGQTETGVSADPEVPAPDEAYCNALAYGMPNTVGLGLGLDRLVMLLTGATSLRDVVGFVP